MNVTQHMAWVFVLEAAAERFCLDPADLEQVRRQGIPAMLEWAKETGVTLTVPDEPPAKAETREELAARFGLDASKFPRPGQQDA